MALEERLVAGGQLEGIDIERALVRDCAHQGKPRVLIPPSGLVEVRERRKQQDEERGACAAGIGHWPLQSRRVATRRIVMLTTSPTTVAMAAPLAPNRGIA